MFEKLVPLDKKQHAHYKLKSNDDFKFASQISMSLLGGSEVAEASKFFPIVFPEKDTEKHALLPMALMGLGVKKNSFVSDDGKWMAGYIPNHIKRYPFIFGAIPDKKKQFAIMMDMEAPQLSEKEGQPLFNSKGEPEKIISNVKTFLTHFQADIDRTETILSDMEKYDILVSKQFTIRQGEKKVVMRGFRVVDTKKLAELDDSVLSSWVRNGLMGIVFAHIHSLTNIKKIQRAK